MRRNGTALLTKVIIGIRMQEERAERNATHGDVSTAAAHADAPSFDATHVNTKRNAVAKEAVFPIATAHYADNPRSLPGCLPALGGSLRATRSTGMPRTASTTLPT